MAPKATGRKNRQMCEGCRLKRPNYGLPAEARARWCGPCAKTLGVARPSTTAILGLFCKSPPRLECDTLRVKK